MGDFLNKVKGFFNSNNNENKNDDVRGYSSSNTTNTNNNRPAPIPNRATKVTFSNVKWEKFDNVSYHAHSIISYPFEPRVHVIAEEENIAFHGYNMSKMDEGVKYTLKSNMNFSIECNVNTSTISPHPGGYLYINFGILSAQIKVDGGTFTSNGAQVCKTGAQFKMKLAVSGEKYQIFIDGALKDERYASRSGDIQVIFGFTHDTHDCKKLSHAYLTNIKMEMLPR